MGCVAQKLSPKVSLTPPYYLIYHPRFSLSLVWCEVSQLQQWAARENAEQTSSSRSDDDDNNNNNNNTHIKNGRLQ